LHQGDEYTKLCIVFEGTCISEMNDYTGRSVVLGTFPAPFPVAPGFLFADDPRLPISLRARTAVDVLLIPKSVISSFLHQNPRFTAGFLTLLSNRIGYLTERVSFHSCKTIREKLLSYLCSLSNEEDSTVTIPMSMEDLARYFGVARPSLSQGFVDLQKEGRIRKDGRTVTLTGMSGRAEPGS
jgi:CRP/FNR family transcriptional regulator